MVTRDGGEFRIGVLDLATKAFRTVSDGNLDESPSFAPNGSMIIYAARAQGRGVLFAVSADGRTRQRLALDVGDVREPVWSPYSKR
jgi:TolB protein